MIRQQSRWIAGLSAASVVAVFVGVAALLGADRATTPTPTARPVIAAQHRPAETHVSPSDYLGVGSCTATACHGGVDPNPNEPSWHSSYAVWASRDRHAKAYSVLRGDRSVAILKALDSHDPAQAAVEPKPWMDQRCLVCHASPSMDSQTNHWFVDGVGCEACHGPAGDWLARHTTSGWSQLSAAQKAAFGMRDTADVIERAALCARCHVGDPTPTPYQTPRGEPVVADVNHDLIAAGHPRLTFEYATFAARMPKHWKPEAVSNAEARDWAVGQVVSAAAEAKLRQPHTTKGLEFADYDCYACHHQLRDKGVIPPSDAAGGGAAKIGGLRPGVWHTTMLRPLSTILKVQPLEPAAHGRDNAVAVQREAESLDAEGLRAAMARVAGDGDRLMNWDEATQHYLALVALNNSRQLRLDEAAKSSAANVDVAQKLNGLLALLKFPTEVRDAKNEVHYKSDANAESKADKRLDSPANFDPAAVQQAMRDLVKLLQP